MPSQAEIEAAAKALDGKKWPDATSVARAALTAAERVREEARTQPCEDCERGWRRNNKPCRTCDGTGEARTQPISSGYRRETPPEVIEQSRRIQEERHSPETGQPSIPDEAVQAAGEWLPPALWSQVTAALTAALPHLEAAWQQRQTEAELADPDRHLTIEQSFVKTVRASVLAEVREKVKSVQPLNPRTTEQKFRWGYEQAIFDCLTAIQGAGDE